MKTKKLFLAPLKDGVRTFCRTAICTSAFCLLTSYMGFAQNLAINTTGAAANLSAMLHVGTGTAAAGGDTKGILIPRVALSATNNTSPITPAPTATEAGLIVWNTATAGTSPNNVTPGYYYWDGTQWVRWSGGTGGLDWSLLGNAGTVDGTHFIGTTDDKPFNIRVNNQKAGRIDISTGGNTFFGYQAGNFNSGNVNTGIGRGALYSNTSGSFNIASGYFALYSNTTGGGNIASGYYTLYNNTIGNNNTALGLQALNSNVAGSNATAIGYGAMYYANNQSGAFTNYNVALGYEALRGSTTASANTGNYNTALGYRSLYSNTTGSYNTANGNNALLNNTTGSYNTASGYQALLSNIDGIYNTATGRLALYSNNNGSHNTATGASALYSASSCQNNTANGHQALYANISGNDNTAIGMQALFSTTGTGNTASGTGALFSTTIGDYNTASGLQALLFNTSGSFNTAIGRHSGLGAAGIDFNQCTFVGGNSYPTLTRTNVTMLGYGITNGECTADNQVCVGNTAVTQIRAAVTGITAYSDARFKTNIKEDVAGLDFILKLKPVTYNVRPKELHKIWGTPDSLVNKIDHTEAEQETRIGFLAQDVEKAAKESGFNFPGIDVPRNDKEVYTLRYVDFIMPMVKAVQELNDSNESLKFEVSSLKLKNEEQKKTNDELKTEIGKLQTTVSELQTNNSELIKDVEKIKQQLSSEAKK